MAKGKKTGGRQKGTLNKLSLNVKESVLAVYEKVGGEAGFASWAAENRTEFYKIFAKLIPRDIVVEGDMAVRLEDLVAGGEDPNSK